MSENNEISNASSPETDAQPSLDLPGRRKTRVGRLSLVVVALMMIALGAAGVTVYLQRLFQQHQEAKQAALNKPKDTASSDATTDLEAQKMRIKRDEADRARQASEAAAAAAKAGLRRPQVRPRRRRRQIRISRPELSPTRQLRLRPRNVGYRAVSSPARATGMAPTTPARAAMTAAVFQRWMANGDSSGSGSGGMADLAKSTGLAALRGAAPYAGGDRSPAQRKVVTTIRAPHSTNRCSRRSCRDACLVPSEPPLSDQPQYADPLRAGHGHPYRPPGLIGCTVAQDVWSDDGSTLLVRKGAKAKGEQRDAVLQGQGSIAVIWDEIDDGDVTIPLNSPATDPLGAAGIPAYVDEHFWLRFKGALMVSLIGDFGQALANKATGSGQQITFSNSSNATQDVAAETLRNTINIPPTAYSNQGSVINIFVARDIDLSQRVRERWYRWQPGRRDDPAMRR